MKRTILGALGMVALMLAVMILPLGGCAPEAAAPPEERGTALEQAQDLFTLQIKSNKL